jgi:hypothetical protein
MAIKDLKIVNLPIYNFGLILVNRTKFKYTKENVETGLEKMGYKKQPLEIEFIDTSIASCYNLAPLKACIIINKPINRETIAHECVHLTSYLFRGIGETHDFDTNDEHYGYILQHFYTIVEDFCADNKIINK